MATFRQKLLGYDLGVHRYLMRCHTKIHKLTIEVLDSSHICIVARLSSLSLQLTSWLDLYKYPVALQLKRVDKEDLELYTFAACNYSSNVSVLLLPLLDTQTSSPAKPLHRTRILYPLWHDRLRRLDIWDSRNNCVLPWNNALARGRLCSHTGCSWLECNDTSLVRLLLCFVDLSLNRVFQGWGRTMGVVSFL